jgi:hypothetical protein
MGLGIAGIVFIAVFLLGQRLAEFGPLNVFSREYAFSEQGPLSDALAVELTGRTLAANGESMARMRPNESHWPVTPQNPDRYLIRDLDNPNRGYVYWYYRDGSGWNYYVHIEKVGSTFRCRALRPM